MNRIIPAKSEDKDEIFSLYKSMLYGPADWNEYYPNEETIEFDLSRNALYVVKNSENHTNLQSYYRQNPISSGNAFNGIIG